MKKNNYMLLVVMAILCSCNVTTEKTESGNNEKIDNQITCDNAEDIWLYNKGVEIAAIGEYGNARSFEDAIAQYNDASGLNVSFLLNNQCAIKGYNERIKGGPNFEK